MQKPVWALNIDICYLSLVRPPSTNSSILGIYRSPTIITIISVVTISGWGPTLIAK